MEGKTKNIKEKGKGQKERQKKLETWIKETVDSLQDRIILKKFGNFARRLYCSQKIIISYQEYLPKWKKRIFVWSDRGECEEFCSYSTFIQKGEPQPSEYPPYLVVQVNSNLIDG